MFYYLGVVISLTESFTLSILKKTICETKVNSDDNEHLYAYHCKKNKIIKLISQTLASLSFMQMQ